MTVTVFPGHGGRIAPLPQNRWDMAPAPFRAPTVSVVIAFYQQNADLDRLLAALDSQRGHCHIVDVTVVDDGSDPPLQIEPATVGGVSVRVLHQDDRGCRPAAARNLGAGQARGEVLVFLDADTMPGPETVARLVQLPAVVPDSVVVGRRHHVDVDGWAPSRIVSWLGDRVEPPPRTFEDPAWLCEGYERTRDLLDVDDRSYQWIIGAVMATSRRFFDELGGFDASIDTYGGEDWEFAYRAFAAGAVLQHERRAVAFHNGPAWAERNGWRGRKNSERLAIRRTVPGPADPIRGPYSQHLFTLDVSGWSSEQTVATTASILSDPTASVAVAIPDADGTVVDVMASDGRVMTVRHGDEILRRALTETIVSRPVQLESVARLVALVAPGGSGEVVIDDHGQCVATVTSLRARARVRRWRRPGDDDGAEANSMAALFGRSHIEAASVGLRPVAGPVDLDAVFPR